MDLLKEACGTDVFATADLDEGLTACKEEGKEKCWLVIEAGSSALAAVHTALKDGTARLAVLLVANQGPVSQLELLRALEYGGVYAAASEMATGVKVLREAAGFKDGGAFVMLAKPEAISGDSKWTSFSYDPRRSPCFQSGLGGDVRKELQAFLLRESMLTLVANKNLPAATQSGAAAGEGAGGAAKSVTIAYSSDTGRGEACAKAIMRQCRSGGYDDNAVKCVPLNALEPMNLASQEMLVVCISTAGKGQFPGNGQAFWTKLTEAQEQLKGQLGGLKYAVFGLGDSHYWGKGTAASKENFAKPAKDLDTVFEQCGAQRLIPTGFGDDQDQDSYHQGFSAFKAKLYATLGVNASAAAAGGGAAAPAPPGPEAMKTQSGQLRGTIYKSLTDNSTGTIPGRDFFLLKCHGGYMQDNRDLRGERQQLGIENAMCYMIRFRLPGGHMSAEQFIVLDDLCQKYADGTMKMSNRQSMQMHGLLKKDFITTMRAANKACMDSVAIGGDICRNILCTADPSVCSKANMEKIMEAAYAVSDHMLPRTGAFHEIFIMEGPAMAEKCQILGSTPKQIEPFHGLTYLGVRCKFAFAIPPLNDVEVFGQDLGFIAIIENGEFLGFNVSVGGSMGFTYANKITFPRLGSIIGFCKASDTRFVAEALVEVMRDFGDRTNARKHGRMKYVVEDFGMDFVKGKMEEYMGFEFEPARRYKFTTRTDNFGWSQTEDGMNHCLIQVPMGRIKGDIRVALRKVAELLKGVGRYRNNAIHNFVIMDVPNAKKDAVESILAQHKVPRSNSALSGLRRNMMACTALPYCPLSFAESERYLPTLVDRLEGVVERVGLLQENISIRMSGCPNACGRPPASEIGLIGKAPGSYNLYLGGDALGYRLNTLYKEGLDEDEIVGTLTPMLTHYSAQRLTGESFGDFIIRMQYVQSMKNGGHLWWTVGVAKS